MKIIALIPARKGSKGIQNKNMQLLNQLPLVEHTIQDAHNTKDFDEIWISSDDNRNVLELKDCFVIKPLEFNFSKSRNRLKGKIAKSEYYFTSNNSDFLSIKDIKKYINKL